MTDAVRAPSEGYGDAGAWWSALRMALARPATLLVVLSAIFGSTIVLLNPPLRGPDEPAHFLRVYAYAHGVILPSTEVDGRRGIYLPARIHDDFAYFHDQIGKVWTPGFTFRDVMNEHRLLRAVQPKEDDRPPVFVPYQGSEGYTLAAYAPHVAAALVARVLGLDLPSSITLMRLFSLAVFTAVAAYAVAVTPYLKWAFFLVAMLPAALYGRSVVGADGATLSFTLMIIALSLRAISLRRADGAWERALWITLCVLAKPPQVAFVLLEPMIHRMRQWPRRWRTIALVTAPGLVLTAAWIWAVDAEMAAWRIYADAGHPREHFELGWKLRFMLENPLHFPHAMFATLFGEAFGLWRQLVGVLGWLDTHLHTGIYVAISLAFALTAFERLSLEPHVRWRIAVFSLLIVASYVTAVFLILFATWTPPEETVVWGVQGRYFTHVLPLVALAVAALANAALPVRFVASAAVFGALVSGLACIEGLWRVNWAG
jgi:uncharacterized membrane protein